MDSFAAELERCKREIDRLTEENVVLRSSSESFAALAQRLHDLLNPADKSISAKPTKA